MPEEKREKKQPSIISRIVIYVIVAILGAFLISILYRHLREDPEEVYRKNSNLRVEVLNGCGVNRLALKVTNLLRKQGFNVVTIGNTEEPTFEETVVLERSDENMVNARYFAHRIGCRNIGKDIDPALYVEITVIIGKDYEKIFKEIDEEF
jgi:hypothetical protein